MKEMAGLKNEIERLKELIYERKEKQAVVIGIALLTAFAYAFFMLPFTVGYIGMTNGFLGMFLFFGLEIIIALMFLLEIQEEIDEKNNALKELVEII